MMKFKIQLILSLSVLSFLISFGSIAQTQSQKFGTNPTNIAPSAVLEIESTNKGVLFPRVTLSSTSDLTTIASPATGLTVFNTANAGTSPSNVTPGYYYWNGSKWVKMAIETPFAKTVYVNATSPTTATIFDENNPPATNDNALKDTDVNLYIGNDGSTWTYNTSTSEYNTFTVPASTPFNLANTNTDAGSEKINAIWRSGRVGIGTNNPLTQLQVQHPTAATNTVNADAQVLRLSRPSNSGVKEDNFAQFNLGSYENTGTSSFQAKTRLDLALKDGVGTASTNVMTWNANGRVGILNTAPVASLDVISSVGATATVNADVPMLKLTRPTFNGKWGGVAQFSLGSYNTNAIAQARLDIGLNNGGDITTIAPVMTLQGDGNVGIATTAPTQRLDVNGTGLFRRGNGGTGGSANQILFSHNGSNEWVHAIKTRHNGGGIQGNAIDFYAYSFTTNGNTNPTGIGSQHLMSLEVGRVGIGGITGPTSVIDAASTGLATASVNASRKMLRLSIPTATDVKVGNVAEFNMGSYAVSGTNARSRLDLLLNDGLDNTVSQVMTWQANGNVGIGTTTPTTTLEVANTNNIAFQSTINAFSNPSASASNGFNNNNPDVAKVSSGIQFLGWNGKKEGGVFRQTGSADKSHLLFAVNTTNDVAMVINESRNVGIGTTSPANKLEITQGTAGNSGLRFTNLNSASAAATSSNKVLALNSTGDVILANIPNTQNIVSFSTATPTTAGVVFDPNTPTDQSVIYQSETDNSLWTYNGTSYVTYTPPASTAWNLAGTTNDAGNNKTAAIWRNGNVAIGTQNPTATFEVATTSGLTSILRRGAAALQTPSNLILQKTANANPAVNTAIPDGDHIGRILFSAANGTNYLTNGTSIIGYAAGLQSPTNNGGGISFRTVPQGSISTAVERMRIEHNGNVGIGTTTTPTTTLEVANINTIAFQSTINASSNPAALGTSGFNDANPNITKASSGIQFLGWSGKKEGGIFRQTGSSDKSHLLFTVNTTNDVAMTINESRNVGIGTTAPSSKLEINSGTAGTSGLEFTQLTAASANTSTANTNAIGVNANGEVVPLGNSKRAEPLATNATFDITVSTFGSYKVTVAGSDAGFRTFADEYIVTYANSFVRLSVAQTGGVHSAGGAQTMQTAYNVATATLTPTHGLYSITFNANGTSNVITTRALASLALITTKTQSLW